MKRLDDDIFATAIALTRSPALWGPECVTLHENHTPMVTGSNPELVVTGLFAGIGGLEEGFRQAGHESAMLCEVDPIARRVLGRHFPDATVSEDINKLTSLPQCDVLTAGFPCQDLSQVGRRQGITGLNSGLIGKVFELLARQASLPKWIVLENVPFMLVLDRGNAIRAVTRGLEALGYAWAYRTVDAQAFGLPQRRRRVILLASRDSDPRPVLLGQDSGAPEPRGRGRHACGFYWTEGNTGLGWAIDSVPPLKGGSALHIPSSPAIWFPQRRLIATPAIEDAERLQGFKAGWTDLSDEEPRSAGKRWRMIGNAVSVPMAKWIAKRLTAETKAFKAAEIVELPMDRGWPAAGWGMNGIRAQSDVSDWPVQRKQKHLASFLEHKISPLSKKATSGFLSRLVDSSLRYEKSFARDLAHHAKNAD
jgi:DNA (cytosine-5)-methyltransferase 1